MVTKSHYGGASWLHMYPMACKGDPLEIRPECSLQDSCILVHPLLYS